MSFDIFKCPVCGSRMYRDNLKSLICSNNHCFDISKSGYVNLLLKPVKNKYDKELFGSRSKVCEMGFFDPLIDSVVNLICDNIFYSDSDDTSCKRILDAGCGEGYHLSRIIRKLKEKQKIHF